MGCVKGEETMLEAENFGTKNFPEEKTSILQGVLRISPVF